MNATLLQQHLRPATGTTVSTQTVRKPAIPWCRPHRANLVEDFFFEEGIVRDGMASVFSDMKSNRARLGRSRETSCWPPTPQNSQELERRLFWKSGTEYPNS
ncbi:hypothetical protein TNCV_4295661 [Trichonephila clavipes]|nr:hypothetical protein TNCV_4295661 [Trichonephila clavipes]